MLWIRNYFLQFRFRLQKAQLKIFFFYKVRFRFHIAKSYGSYESGSTTLGSGAFLTPGSGIWNRFFPDPDSLIPDPKPQSLMCTIFTVNGHKKPICRSRSEKPRSEAEFKGRGTCSLIVTYRIQYMQSVLTEI